MFFVDCAAKKETIDWKMLLSNCSFTGMTLQNVHFVIYAIAVIAIRSSSDTEVPGLFPMFS